MNALRHGLAAKTVVLCNESRDRFNLLHDAYIEEFQPATPAEHAAVEEMVAAKCPARNNMILEERTQSNSRDEQAPDHPVGRPSFFVTCHRASASGWGLAALPFQHAAPSAWITKYAITY